MTPPARNRTRPRAWSVAFGIWSLGALVAATLLPAPLAPAPLRLLIVVGPVVIFGLLLALRSSLRWTLSALNPRWLIAAHGIRLLVGTAFFALGHRGLVPWLFALHAGTGDMIAGAGAIVLAIAFPRLRGQRGRSLLLAWNLFGILDFLNVQRVLMGFAGRGHGFVALKELPMALVPYWGVPLLWSIHVYLIATVTLRPPNPDQG